MIRILSALRWPLFAAYVLAGGAAVMMATPIGLTALGLSLDSWLSRNARLSLGYDQRFGSRGDYRQLSLRFQQAF